MPGQYHCTVQVNGKDKTVIRFDPCRCIPIRDHFSHLMTMELAMAQFYSTVGTISTVLCNQVQECDEVYSGSVQIIYTRSNNYSVLRLIYYDGYEKPRVFLRVPGTSSEALQNTVADLVPTYSGNKITVFRFYNVIGKSIPCVDLALMNKTAKLKINDDLSLSFLPEIEQD